jgi:phage-related minor tail protein
MQLDVYHHFPSGDAVILSALQRIETKLGEIHMANARIEAALGRIDATTTKIGVDVGLVGDQIRDLKSQISTGMSSDEVEAVGVALDDKATKLDAAEAALALVASPTDPNATAITTAAP